MRNWIDIKGRKLYWISFIGLLDTYRSRKIVWACGDTIRQKYNEMIFVLQELTAEYHDGDDYIADGVTGLITDSGMTVPVIKKFPMALEELYLQMEAKLHIDLDSFLEECEEKSKQEHQCVENQYQEEQERIHQIESFGMNPSLLESVDTLDKITYLISLQDKKEISANYQWSDKELQVTTLWCELLFRLTYKSSITYGIMRRAVEDDIVSEKTIEILLRNTCQIEKDYEW